MDAGCWILERVGGVLLNGSSSSLDLVTCSLSMRTESIFRMRAAARGCLKVGVEACSCLNAEEAFSADGSDLLLPKTGDSAGLLFIAGRLRFFMFDGIVLDRFRMAGEFTSFSFPTFRAFAKADSSSSSSSSDDPIGGIWNPSAAGGRVADLLANETFSLSCTV